MSVTEKAVVGVDELKNGEMIQVEVGETPVLLCRVDDHYYALGAHCTHYGAPLAEGSLRGNQVICPWHHAEFDVTNGDNNEPPALDGLPTYPIHERDGKIVVKVPDDTPSHRIMKMGHLNIQNDTRDFVIVGAGAAGESAAETLRRLGFEGRIFMISYEDRLPYDRPNLSKEYLSGDAKEEWMPLRGDGFYGKYDIELTRNRVVREVDVESRIITFADSATQHYDEVLIATGGLPRTLDIPGNDLNNVFTLRSFDDADQIIGKLEKGKKAVIIGSSFIGMETAASLRKRGVDVHVVSIEEAPFSAVFGDEIGAWFQDKHEKTGVRFSLGTTAVEFKGENGNVRKVVLKNGETLDADLVLVGIGVRPNTGFIKGLPLEKDGGVRVDQNLKAADHVYAAGDIAWFPYWKNANRPVRIEHWRLAQQHGRIAAHNMLGKQVPFRSIPFFWSNQGEAKIKYLGYAKGWDDLIIDGDVKNDDFMAYYVSDNKIAAVATPNRSTRLAAIHHLMIMDEMPEPHVVGNRSFDPVTFLKKS